MDKQIISILAKDIINKTNINIIDIREPYELSYGKIPNSKNIPLNGLFLNHTSFLDKQQTYYIACLSGGRSYRTCRHLATLGYNVINIADGFLGYLKATKNS